MQQDTIFALSSGRPPAAIAVVRISGPCAHGAAAALSGALPEPRVAALRTLRDPASGQELDQALVLRFDGPASATGEDLVELYCHGGRAVVDAVLRAIGGCQRTRGAEPGEFTRRAFDNGRIDLTEAEGLADLLEAETEAQRRAALALAEGGLRQQIGRWQEQLLALSARAELAIDHADDGDETTDPMLNRDCGALAAELDQWLQRPRIEPLKDGVRVVVAGPPNAGKSSLVNAIAGQERAIVSDSPGTTRDYLEAALSLSGLPIVLTDTAGLREAVDAVETIGVERARGWVMAADVLLWLGEPEDAPSHPRLIRLWAKSDLRDEPAPPALIAVSSVTGAGLPQLLDRMAELARTMLPGEDALALNRRQAAHVEAAHEALTSGAAEHDVVLLAEHLRSARGEFDRLTGRAGVEEVLDALFGRFCLGK